MSAERETARLQVAVILAAGRGSRLLPLTEDLPKCLLEVGEETILSFQLRSFAEGGITEVIIVTGFGADLVQAAVAGRAGARCILNEEWATTNSLCSLTLARPLVAGRPFLLCNGDVLFHRDVLELLVGETTPTALSLDAAGGRGAEEMKVRVEDGCVREISKDIPGDESDGENLGLLKFGATGGEVLFEEAERLVIGGEGGNWAPRAYNEVITREPIAVVEIGGLPWAEIDTPEDLEHARSVVYPACTRTRLGSRSGSA